MKLPAMAYDTAKRSAVFTFKNGRTLQIDNVTEEQAKRFQEKNAVEFEARDCRFTTDGGEFVARRESRDGD